MNSYHMHSDTRLPYWVVHCTSHYSWNSSGRLGESQPTPHVYIDVQLIICIIYIMSIFVFQIIVFFVFDSKSHAKWTMQAHRHKHTHTHTHTNGHAGAKWTCMDTEWHWHSYPQVRVVSESGMHHTDTKTRTDACTCVEKLSFDRMAFAMVKCKDLSYFVIGMTRNYFLTTIDQSIKNFRWSLLMHMLYVSIHRSKFYAHVCMHVFSPHSALTQDN